LQGKLIIQSLTGECEHMNFIKYSLTSEQSNN